MASIQKKRDRFAAELIRRKVPFENWNAIDDDSGRLRSSSNIIGLSLSAYGAAAFVFEFGFMILALLASFIFGGFFDINALRAQSSDLYYILMISSYIVYMFVPLILLAFLLRKSPVRDVAARRVRRPAELLPAAVVTIGFYFVGVLASGGLSYLLSLIHLQPSEPDFALPSALLPRILFVVLTCALAPVMEEFVFRGFILHALRRFGDVFAVVVSALLFALLHGNLVQGPFAFVVGLALGYFVLRFGSIWATVVLHACVNSVSLLISLAELRWGDKTMGLALSYAAGPFILLMVLCIAYFALRSAKDGHVLKKPDSGIPHGMRARRFFLTPGFWLFAAISVAFIVSNLHAV